MSIRRGRRRHYNENFIVCTLNIIRVIKSRRSWADHVVRMERR